MDPVDDIAMRIDILTIFPEFFDSPLDASLIGKARQKGVLEIAARDLRDFTHDKHRTVDSSPYGGGPGMLMMAAPFLEAVPALLPGIQVNEDGPPDVPAGSRVIMFAPHGRPLDQPLCRELSAEDHLVLICGRYEGIDARVEDALCTDVISIGDYVLMGGEAAALVLIEAVTRLIPGVIGTEASVHDESFSEGLLEYPQYTNPEVIGGRAVPTVLRSGHHAQVAEWRAQQSLERTRRVRPDMKSPGES